MRDPCGRIITDALHIRFAPALKLTGLFDCGPRQMSRSKTHVIHRETAYIGRVQLASDELSN